MYNTNNHKQGILVHNSMHCVDCTSNIWTYILPFLWLCWENVLSNSEITGARSKTPWHLSKTGASLTKTGALLTDNRSRSQPVSVHQRH